MNDNVKVNPWTLQPIKQLNANEDFEQRNIARLGQQAFQNSQKQNDNDTVGNGAFGHLVDAAQANAAGLFAGQLRAVDEGLNWAGEQLGLAEKTGTRDKNGWLEQAAQAMDEVQRRNTAQEELTGLNYVAQQVGSVLGSMAAMTAETAALGGVGAIAGRGIGALAKLAGYASKINKGVNAGAIMSTAPKTKSAIECARKMWSGNYLQNFYKLQMMNSPMEALGQAGNLLKQLEDEGYDRDTIRSAALWSGSLNAAFLPLANMAEGKVASAFANNIIAKNIIGKEGAKAALTPTMLGAKATLGKAAGTAAWQAFSEGGEEGVQDYIDQFSTQTAQGKDFNDMTWDHATAAKSFVDAAVGSAALGLLGGGVSNYRSRAKNFNANGHNIQLSNDGRTWSVDGKDTVMKPDFDENGKPIVDEKGNQTESLQPYTPKEIADIIGNDVTEADVRGAMRGQAAKTTKVSVGDAKPVTVSEEEATKETPDNNVAQLEQDVPGFNVSEIQDGENTFTVYEDNLTKKRYSSRDGWVIPDNVQDGSAIFNNNTGMIVRPNTTKPTSDGGTVDVTTGEKIKPTTNNEGKKVLRLVPLNGKGMWRSDILGRNKLTYTDEDYAEVPADNLVERPDGTLEDTTTGQLYKKPVIEQQVDTSSTAEEVNDNVDDSLQLMPDGRIVNTDSGDVIDTKKKDQPQWVGVTKTYTPRQQAIENKIKSLDDLYAINKISRAEHTRCVNLLKENKHNSRKSVEELVSYVRGKKFNAPTNDEIQTKLNSIKEKQLEDNKNEEIVKQNDSIKANTSTKNAEPEQVEGEVNKGSYEGATKNHKGRKQTKAAVVEEPKPKAAKKVEPKKETPKVEPKKAEQKKAEPKKVESFGQVAKSHSGRKATATAPEEKTVVQTKDVKPAPVAEKKKAVAQTATEKVKQQDTKSNKIDNKATTFGEVKKESYFEYSFTDKNGANGKISFTVVPPKKGSKRKGAFMNDIELQYDNAAALKRVFDVSTYPRVGDGAVSLPNTLVEADMNIKDMAYSIARSVAGEKVKAVNLLGVYKFKDAAKSESVSVQEQAPVVKRDEKDYVVINLDDQPKSETQKRFEAKREEIRQDLEREKLQAKIRQNRTAEEVAKDEEEKYGWSFDPRDKEDFITLYADKMRRKFIEQGENISKLQSSPARNAEKVLSSTFEYMTKVRTVDEFIKDLAARTVNGSNNDGIIEWANKSFYELLGGEEKVGSLPFMYYGYLVNKYAEQQGKNLRVNIFDNKIEELRIQEDGSVVTVENKKEVKNTEEKKQDVPEEKILTADEVSDKSEVDPEAQSTKTLLENSSRKKLLKQIIASTLNKIEEGLELPNKTMLALPRELNKNKYKSKTTKSRAEKGMANIVEFLEAVNAVDNKALDKVKLKDGTTLRDYLAEEQAKVAKNETKTVDELLAPSEKEKEEYKKRQDAITNSLKNADENEDITPLTKKYIEEKLLEGFKESIRKIIKKAAVLKAKNNNAEFDDVLQECCIAAREAAATFKEGKGAKLTTHITNYLKSVKADQGTTVTESTLNKIKEYNKAVKALEEKIGRELGNNNTDYALIANEMGLLTDAYDNDGKIIKAKLDDAVNKVAQIAKEKYNQNPISVDKELDVDTGDNDAATFGDTLSGTGELDSFAIEKMFLDEVESSVFDEMQSDLTAWTFAEQRKAVNNSKELPPTQKASIVSKINTAEDTSVRDTVLTPENEKKVVAQIERLFRGMGVKQISPHVYDIKLPFGGSLQIDMTTTSAQLINELGDKVGPLRTIAGIKDGNIAGLYSFENGINLIRLTDAVRDGTVPHEVAHFIFNAIFNPIERRKIIDYYKTKITDRTGLTENQLSSRAEELFCDDFAKYFLNQKDIPRSKLQMIFERMKNFLRKLVDMFSFKNHPYTEEELDLRRDDVNVNEESLAALFGRIANGDIYNRGFNKDGRDIIRAQLVSEGQAANLPDTAKAVQKAKMLLDKGMDPTKVWEKTGCVRYDDGTVKMYIPFSGKDIRGTGLPGDFDIMSLPVEPIKWGNDIAHARVATVNLTDILTTRNKLFSLVPSLKGVKVKYVFPETRADYDRTNNTEAYYSNRDNVIYLRVRDINLDGSKIIQNLAHELQHAIQFGSYGADRDVLLRNFYGYDVRPIEQEARYAEATFKTENLANMPIPARGESYDSFKSDVDYYGKMIDDNPIFDLAPDLRVSTKNALLSMADAYKKNNSTPVADVIYLEHSISNLYDKAYQSGRFTVDELSNFADIYNALGDMSGRYRRKQAELLQTKGKLSMPNPIMIGEDTLGYSSTPEFQAMQVERISSDGHVIGVHYNQVPTLDGKPTTDEIGGAIINAKKKLIKKKLRKPDAEVQESKEPTIKDPFGTGDENNKFGLFDMLRSPFRLAKKFPKVFAFFENIFDRAYETQNKLRFGWHNMLKEATEFLSTVDDFNLFNDLMLYGDSYGENGIDFDANQLNGMVYYTDAEGQKVFVPSEQQFIPDGIETHPLPENVAKAYLKVRELTETIYAAVDRARRSGLIKTEKANLKRILEIDDPKTREEGYVEIKGSDGEYHSLAEFRQYLNDKDTYDIRYAKIRLINKKAVEVGVTQERVDEIKNDDTLEFITATENKDVKGTFNVQYIKYMPHMGHRRGHVPHIFERWMVAYVNDDGSYTIQDSQSTVNKARESITKFQEDDAENNIQRQYVIFPKAFDFGSFNGADEVVGGGALATQKQKQEMYVNLVKNYMMTPDEANKAVSAAMRTSTKNRIYGQAVKRKGVAGFSKDVIDALVREVTSASRYCAMQPAKFGAINKYENLFGMNYDADVKISDNPLQAMIKGYIDDCNGKPSKAEQWLNRSLNNWKFYRENISATYGDRAILGMASKANQIVSMAKLGFWNISSAIVNLLQSTNTMALCGFSHFGEGVKAFRDLKMKNKDQLSGKELDEYLLNERIIEQTGVKYNIGMDSAMGYQQRLSWINNKADIATPQGFLKTIYDGYLRIGDKGLTLFSGAEAANRQICVLAAYRDGIAKGMNHEEAIEYAREVNKKANFDYGVSDTPAFMRAMSGTGVGEMMMLFQKYPVKELELMCEMCKKALSNTEGDKAQAARFWGLYFLMSGIGGIPGLDALDEWLEHLFGYKPSKRAKLELFDTFGDNAMTRSVCYGIGAAAGIDISQRVGMGDLKFGNSQLMFPLNFGGAAGSTLKQMIEAAMEGDPAHIAKAFSPAMGAIMEAGQGYSTDKKGRLRTLYSVPQRIARATAFRPVEDSINADLNTALTEQRSDDRSSKSAFKYQIALKQTQGQPLTEDDKRRLRDMKISGKQLADARKQIKQSFSQRAKELMSKEQRQRYGTVYDEFEREEDEV